MKAFLLNSWATATSVVSFFFSPVGRQGEKDLRELMVASQIIPSVSDSNHLMSLEAEQSVAIFLLFILPLKSYKIKKERL